MRALRGPNWPRHRKKRVQRRPICMPTETPVVREWWELRANEFEVRDPEKRPHCE